MAPLPSFRQPARNLLLSHPTFTAVIMAERLVFKQPADVTTKFAVIQVPGNSSLSGDNVAWSPLIQVDGYCPADDPAADDIAWDIAAAAAEVFGRARNIIVGAVSYSARVIDLLAASPDVSRGPATPLARALMRAELTVHNR